VAKIVRRVWRSGPRKVKRVAFGYTLMVDGRQVRKYDAAWTEDDARAALVAAQRGDAEVAAPSAIVEPEPTSAPSLTLTQVVEEYLAYKVNAGKRSLREDRRILRKRIIPTFGPELPIRSLTEAAIAQYERQRIGQVSAFTVRNELTILRHMLRLAKRWGVRGRGAGC
jgi:hypothetical protein